MANPPRGIVPATREDALHIATGLARDHSREVYDLCGLRPQPAVLLSLDASLAAYTWKPGPATNPVFIIGTGAAGLLTGEAVVWMVGTSEASRYATALVRAARWGIDHAFAITGAKVLEQYIPDWYETGLRFVRRLGFALERSDRACRTGGVVWRAIIHRPASPSRRRRAVN